MATCVGGTEGGGTKGAITNTSVVPCIKEGCSFLEDAIESILVGNARISNIISNQNHL
jgi:hypothetical protein